MKIQILDVRQCDPYNKIVTVKIKETKGILKRIDDSKIVKVIGDSTKIWHFFPSMDRVPVELEYELNLISDTLYPTNLDTF